MSSYSLPIFPLETVICPGGQVELKIYEVRYLDLVSSCLRGNNHFGIVTLLSEGTTDEEGEFFFGQVGVVVKIIDADVPMPGLMTIRAQALHRIKVLGYLKEGDGLYMAEVEDIPNDLPLTVPSDLQYSVEELQKEVMVITQKGDELPFEEPYLFDNAGWVANRWIELLDLSLVEKQRLMALDSPIVRLELVQDTFNVKRYLEDAGFS